MANIKSSKNYPIQHMLHHNKIKSYNEDASSVLIVLKIPLLYESLLYINEIVIYATFQKFYQIKE